MAVDLEHGLPHQTASRRLAQDGYNELPSAKPRRLWRIAYDVVREPMFLLLIACGMVYMLIGNRQEAAMLLAFVFIIIGISFFQNRKAERALEALRNLSSPRALVIREGVQHRIPGREVVRGDLLIIVEGDRIAADAVLLAGVNMVADESLLTGESVPVRKAAAVQLPECMGQPGGDDLPFLFSGALIVQGKGIAQVLATGTDTALGRIGKALQPIAPEATGLQREIVRIVRFVAWASLLISLLLGIYYAFTRNDWLQGALVGLTFAMAVLPEELPVVLTLFLGLGAWRLAQQKVLTRHVPAIEMLGMATVLCVDKTGTLTHNRMALASMYAEARHFDFERHGHEALPEEYHALLEFGMLASHRDPFDPMELAIKQALEAKLENTEHIHRDWTLVDEYPLSPAQLAMSRVWQSPDRERYVIAAKGSPEAIFDLCHLPEPEVKLLSEAASHMAGQGLRVLGVARASFRNTVLPEIQHAFEFEFLGLLGLADPLRANVPAAIRESHAAGMRVIMITGDFPATALSIARQAGLAVKGKAMTGAELDALSDAQLQERVRHVDVFCRAVPEHKLRLVRALKANGEIVAMTGDGVNDAPALKAAHIGIAMGARGTDVAREAAELVLVNDDFSAIVAAVRMGRRVFGNLRKAVTFIVGAHVPIVGLSILPVAFGWPLVLLPVHILFLQLIIDPACSIVFEAEPDEPDSMRRPPRSARTSLFDRRSMALGLLQGTVALALLLGVYGIALRYGRSAGEARALVFSVMVIANLGLIFANRAHTARASLHPGLRNRSAAWVAAGTLAILTLALMLPALRELFYFEPLRGQDLAAIPMLAAAGIAAFDLIRRQMDACWRRD